MISAEIPDRLMFLQLHLLVTTKMMNGPCGTQNPNNVCMDNDICTKSFPKPFTNDTFLTENSYPHYCRRNDGREVIVRGVPLDNRWVIPYNPYILSKYGSHINVEAVSSIGCIKYMYKYVYKGHDAAEIGFHNDEIDQYLDARYVSASEAAYRLFEFPMQGKSHSVQKLALHLPDKQSVYFMKGEEVAAVEKALELDTQLTAWFSLNSNDNYARQFLYAEIPLHYCWIEKTRRWQRRKRSRKVVTRIVSVSPRDVERYHLRLLLLFMPGATCYQDLLRSPAGGICSSFLESCSKRQLLDDDEVF